MPNFNNLEIAADSQPTGDSTDVEVLDINSLGNCNSLGEMLQYAAQPTTNNRLKVNNSSQLSGVAPPVTKSGTQITTPSEVSQSTAISDRPKVKPVSKKDGKYMRKPPAFSTLPVLQQNQMVSIYNNLVCPPV